MTGGLVGTNDVTTILYTTYTGMITNSYATGAVSSTASSPGADHIVGGLVGVNDGTIMGSTPTGVVKTSTSGDLAFIGGLAGGRGGSIRNCTRPAMSPRRTRRWRWWAGFWLQWWQCLPVLRDR